MKHPHAEILIAIAEGKEIEIKKICGKWFPVHYNSIFEQLNTIDPSLLRIKLETILINGFNINKPESKPLKLGQTYYLVNLSGSTEEWYWDNNGIDNLWLSSGIIHLTQENAIAHSKALLSFTQKS